MSHCSVHTVCINSSNVCICNILCLSSSPPSCQEHYRKGLEFSDSQHSPTLSLHFDHSNAELLPGIAIYMVECGIYGGLLEPTCIIGRAVSFSFFFPLGILNWYVYTFEVLIFISTWICHLIHSTNWVSNGTLLWGRKQHVAEGLYLRNDQSIDVVLSERGLTYFNNVIFMGGQVTRWVQRAIMWEYVSWIRAYAKQINKTLKAACREQPIRYLSAKGNGLATQKREKDWSCWAWGMLWH